VLAKTDIEPSFEFVQGRRPILISMPHNGVQIPDKIKSQMTESAKKLVDTDWYLDKLYQFAIDQGCYLINPLYSRYVIDLNRPQNDENLYPGQNTTGLCPTTQFDNQPIYKTDAQPNQQAINRRVEKYWQPYHEKLANCLQQLKSEFGQALLFEAHSIKSKVPRFFDGQLLDLNFGDFNGQSCSEILSQRLTDWQIDDYSKIMNGRFKGGYITRAYGEPNNNIHAIQLELSQATYMDEEKLQYHQVKSQKIEKTLKKLFHLFYEFIEN